MGCLRASCCILADGCNIAGCPNSAAKESSGHAAPLLDLERYSPYVVIHLLDRVACQLPNDFFTIAFSCVF
jgi:hypothetical protein